MRFRDQSSPLNLFRALFPRWDFFDQIAFQFHIEIKDASSEVWRRLSYMAPLPWYGLFINYRQTLNMAKINIIEHFASDVQNMEAPSPVQIHQLASYHLLRELIRLDRQKKREAGEFVFRVIAENPDKTVVIFESSHLREP